MHVDAYILVHAYVSTIECTSGMLSARKSLPSLSRPDFPDGLWSSGSAFI